MSEIKRWTVEAKSVWSEAPLGEFMSYFDHLAAVSALEAEAAGLRAEVERLKAERLRGEGVWYPFGGLECPNCGGSKFIERDGEMVCGEEDCQALLMVKQGHEASVGR